LRFLRFLLACSAAASIALSAMHREPNRGAGPGVVWTVPTRICSEVYPPVCMRSKLVINNPVYDT